MGTVRESSIRFAVAAVAAAVVCCVGARPGLTADAPSSMTKVGTIAPAAVGQSVNAGKTEAFDLSSALSKGAVVLYFFPKAFTGGCTIEARTYAAKYADFSKLGATIIGISTDPVDVLTKFQAAEAAPQRFVSDPDGAIAKAFGVSFAYNG